MYESLPCDSCGNNVEVQVLTEEYWLFSQIGKCSTCREEEQNDK